MVQYLTNVFEDCERAKGLSADNSGLVAAALGTGLIVFCCCDLLPPDHARILLHEGLRKIGGFEIPGGHGDRPARRGLNRGRTGRSHLEPVQLDDIDGWFESTAGSFGQLSSWSMEHLLTWAVFWQAVGLVVLAGATYFLARPLRTTLERRVGELRLRLRAGPPGESALAHIYAIVFLTPLWLAIGILVQLDLAAGNDLLVVIASLLSAWVLIKLSSSVHCQPPGGEPDLRVRLVRGGPEHPRPARCPDRDA